MGLRNNNTERGSIIRVAGRRPSRSFARVAGVRLAAVAVSVIAIAFSGCGGTAETSVPVFHFDFMDTAQLQSLPPRISGALGDFASKSNIRLADLRGRRLDFGPLVGRVWVVPAAGAQCLVGGPDSETSVSCIGDSEVAQGKGVSLLIDGRPRGGQLVSAFGLTPDDTSEVELAPGDKDKNHCILGEGVFSCNGVGANRLVYTLKTGKQLTFEFPTMP